MTWKGFLQGLAALSAGASRLCGAAAAALLLNLALAQPASSRALDLSDAETAWVASHGPVRVVVGQSLDPYYRVSETDGQAHGYAIDLLDLLVNRAGLSVRYLVAPSNLEAAAMLRDGRADLTPMARINAQRRSELRVPGIVLRSEPVAVFRKGAAEPTFAAGLAGQRVAVAQGSVDQVFAAQHFPKATLLSFATQREVYEAVASGRADVLFGDRLSAIWFIEAKLLNNLQLRRLPLPAHEGFGPLVARNQPMLESVLAKALDSVTQAELSDLARRWLPAGTGVAFASESVKLTDDERRWVARHGDLRVGFDADFAPFTMSSSAAAFDGLGADVLRAAADKIGLRITREGGGNLDDQLDAVRNGSLNTMVGVTHNRERAAAFHMIGPFVSVSTVIAGRVGGPLASSLDDLRDQRLAVLREHNLLPELRSRLPSLRIVERDTQKDVLDAVMRGDADAAIGNALVVNRLLEQYYPGRLRLTGVVQGGNSDLYIAVPRSQSELAQVLKKGFDALTPSELAALKQRWMVDKVETGLPWAPILNWGVPAAAAAFGILLTLLLANRRLRSAREAQRQAARAATAATSARARFIAYLAHDLRGGVGNISTAAKLLREHPQTPMAPMIEAIQTSADQVGALLETTLQSETLLAKGVVLSEHPVNLALWWQVTTLPMKVAAEAKGLQWNNLAALPSLRVLMDDTRLSQVVTNLATNAIKFTRIGEVSVDARWNAVSRRLTIDVMDEGPGITADEKASLFEPYVQGAAGRQVRGGAGLGLTIAQAIVSAMNGSLEALDQDNAASGSHFRVEVTLKPANDAPNTATTPSLSAA